MDANKDKIISAVQNDIKNILDMYEEKMQFKLPNRDYFERNIHHLAIGADEVMHKRIDYLERRNKYLEEKTQNLKGAIDKYNQSMTDYFESLQTLKYELSDL